MTCPTPLLMTPGPTPVAPNVLEALAMPVRSHASPENAATMRRLLRGLRELLGSLSARVALLPGGGMLGMEVSLINHAARGSRVVVVNHGLFGDQFVEMARAHGLVVDDLPAEWGSHVRRTDLDRRLRTGTPPAVVTLTHVDTSTGVLADCKGLVATIRAAAPEAVIVVDAICAAGGIECEMATWDADVVVAATQKALALPPGMAIVALSDRAVSRRQDLDHVSACYADLHQWQPSIDDPQEYCFSTHPTSMFAALEVGLDNIFEEGLQCRFDRHRSVAEFLRHEMRELGFRPLTDPTLLAPTLSVLLPPEDVSPDELRDEMLARGVMVARCLGGWKPLGIRIGHMGNVREPEIAKTVSTAAEALRAIRLRRARGSWAARGEQATVMTTKK